MVVWLAQSEEGSGMELLIWIAALAVLIMVGLLVISLVRKHAVNSDDPPMAGGLGFTLSDMRQMHARGELSDEEFESSKRAIVARGRAALADDSDPDDDR
jgi:uncharacterized membrane protein